MAKYPPLLSSCICVSNRAGIRAQKPYYCFFAWLELCGSGLLSSGLFSSSLDTFLVETHATRTKTAL